VERNRISLAPFFGPCFFVFDESYLDLVKYVGLPAQSFRAVPPDQKPTKTNGFFPIPFPKTHQG